MNCWATAASGWLLTSVMVGGAWGLLLLGVWWDVRTRLGGIAAEAPDDDEEEEDEDDEEDDEKGHVFAKWLTVCGAMAAAIPFVFIFVSRPVGSSLGGLWSVGFLALLVLLFLADLRSTARAARRLLLGLWLGSLAAALAALLALLRAC
jgi:hypothetical protein